MNLNEYKKGLYKINFNIIPEPKTLLLILEHNYTELKELGITEEQAKEVQKLIGYTRKVYPKDAFKIAQLLYSYNTGELLIRLGNQMSEILGDYQEPLPNEEIDIDEISKKYKDHEPQKIDKSDEEE